MHPKYHEKVEYILKAILYTVLYELRAAKIQFRSTRQQAKIAQLNRSSK